MNKFTQAYIECALWSSMDDDCTPLDSNYSASDIHPDTLKRMEEDCENFQSDNAEALIESGLPDERAGHDFWLNRNDHGHGFWGEYFQATCEACNREQTIAIGPRDFSKRDALNDTCPCPYHVCQRLSQASKAWGTFDLYVGDDGMIHGS